MITLKCSRCKEFLPEKQFFKTPSSIKKNRKRNGYNHYCSKCHKEYLSKRYKANPQKHIKVSSLARQKRKKRNYLWLLSYLENKQCMDCGEQDSLVLDFDHVIGEKLSSVSDLARNGQPIIKIITEIDKCEIVCANCHRRRTAKQFKWYSYG